MTYRDHATALRVRLKSERTVRFVLHAEDCLYSSGTILPKHRCTKGCTEVRWANVQRETPKKGTKP
jgi:hypothetical protein